MEVFLISDFTIVIHPYVSVSQISPETYSPRKFLGKKGIYIPFVFITEISEAQLCTYHVKQLSIYTYSYVRINN